MSQVGTGLGLTRRLEFLEHRSSEPRGPHRTAGRDGVPDLRREDRIRDARVPRHEVDLRVPVGADESGEVGERGLGPYPGREDFHARAVATDRNLVALVHQLPAQLEEAREVMAPAQVARVESGPGPGRSRGAEVDGVPVADQHRPLPGTADVAGRLHDVIPSRQVAVPEPPQRAEQDGGRVPDRADQVGVVVVQPIDPGRPSRPHRAVQEERRGRCARQHYDIALAHLGRDVAREGPPHGFVFKGDRQQPFPPSLAVGKAFDGRPRRRAAAFAVAPGAGHEPHPDAFIGEGVGDVLGVDTGGGVVGPGVLREDVDDGAVFHPRNLRSSTWYASRRWRRLDSSMTPVRSVNSERFMRPAARIARGNRPTMRVR